MCLKDYSYTKLLLKRTSRILTILYQQPYEGMHLYLLALGKFNFWLYELFHKIICLMLREGYTPFKLPGSDSPLKSTSTKI